MYRKKCDMYLIVFLNVCNIFKNYFGGLFVIKEKEKFFRWYNREL